MNNVVLLLSLLIPLFIQTTQSKTENDINIAFANAKKGVYWALSNIPEDKSHIQNELIADDKLYSSVKLYKEFNGVKIESIGYNGTDQVTIKIYKSFDSLLKEGFMKSSDPGKKDNN